MIPALSDYMWLHNHAHSLTTKSIMIHGGSWWRTTFYHEPLLHHQLTIKHHYHHSVLAIMIISSNQPYDSSPIINHYPPSKPWPPKATHHGIHRHHPPLRPGRPLALKHSAASCGTCCAMSAAEAKCCTAASKRRWRSGQRPGNGNGIAVAIIVAYDTVVMI